MMKCRVKQEIFSDHFDFLLTTDDGVVTSVNLEPLEKGAYVNPSFSLDDRATQSLMNQLWSQGVRPKNGEGGMAQVEAMKEHIIDLRKMAFARPSLINPED